MATSSRTAICSTRPCSRRRSTSVDVSNANSDATCFTARSTPAGQRLERTAGDWQVGASMQQEVMPDVSVEIGYHRRG